MTGHLIRLTFVVLLLSSPPLLSSEAPPAQPPAPSGTPAKSAPAVPPAPPKAKEKKSEKDLAKELEKLQKQLQEATRERDEILVELATNVRHLQLTVDRVRELVKRPDVGAAALVLAAPLLAEVADKLEPLEKQKKAGKLPNDAVVKDLLGSLIDYRQHALALKKVAEGELDEKAMTKALDLLDKAHATGDVVGRLRKANKLPPLPPIVIESRD